MVDLFDHEGVEIPVPLASPLAGFEVTIIGRFSSDHRGLIYFGFGHPFNLLFWISDQRLLNFIQRVFISNGSAVVDLNTIAEPSTERSGRGGVGKKT